MLSRAEGQKRSGQALVCVSKFCGRVCVRWRGFTVPGAGVATYIA